MQIMPVTPTDSVEMHRRHATGSGYWRQLNSPVTRILEAMKPEAAYFTEQDGKRGAVLVVDLPDPSKIPALAEPWFLTFQADVEFRVVMSPDDLKRAGLDELGKKWS